MFTRNLKPQFITNLLNEPLWQDKLKLKYDCQKGDVFLAIRNNRVDFYYKGGKIFSYDGKRFLTHVKYARIPLASTKDYIMETDLSLVQSHVSFLDIYKIIKDNCAHYSENERDGVSNIIQNYSYTKNNDIVVLDTEIGLDRGNVDILLFNTENSTLQFIEAKRFNNKELWANVKNKNVVDQINKYEDSILKHKINIIEQYVNHINYLNSIFGLALPVPEALLEKVVLLVFDFDQDQLDGSLTKKLKNSPKFQGYKFYGFGNSKKLEIDKLWKAKPLP